jgi:hypothetical protein
VVEGVEHYETAQAQAVAVVVAIVNLHLKHSTLEQPTQ